MSTSDSQASETDKDGKTVPAEYRRTIVIATVKVVGFHAWADAPDEVYYLASKHRHLFTVRVEFDVTSEARQVEFHIAQGWIKRALDTKWGTGPGICNFEDRSCETIARELRDMLAFKGYKASAIEVWEDDENGARVQWCGG